MTLGLIYKARPGAAWEYEQRFNKACREGNPPDQYRPTYRPHPSPQVLDAGKAQPRQQPRNREGLK